MQYDPALRAAAPSSLYARFAALVDTDGSRAHPALTRLSHGRAPIRDLADAFHCLSLLHGRDAGVIAVARTRVQHPVADEWFAVAERGFAGEREWLSRLVVCGGPVPSTAGQTQTENAIATQRHALGMLAQSERRGVAIGAAAALVRDWQALRPMLEAAAHRLCVDYPPCGFPRPQVSEALLDTTPLSAAEERGFLFGAEQLLAQHRGLWALLDARAAARTG